MIEYIEGKLSAKSPSHAVIDTGGVGYRALISLTTFDALPAVGEKLKLWMHPQYREDEHLLFGFATLEERWLFQHLISVNGVGPKLAITMLSSMRPDLLRAAVHSGDAARLKSIPKIGAKIAERIVLELKKKLGTATPDFAMSQTLSGTGEILEAVEALVSLGFTRLEAERAVQTAAERGATGTEELVKRSLRKS